MDLILNALLMVAFQGVVMQRNLSLPMAKTIAEGALAACKEKGYNTAVAVVDQPDVVPLGRLAHGVQLVRKAVRLQDAGAPAFCHAVVLDQAARPARTGASARARRSWSIVAPA